MLLKPISMRSLEAMYRSGAKLLVTLLASVLLAACSSTTFFYHQLDTLIAWYVDDYIDFTRAQSSAFDDEIDTLIAWHQREELPRYVKLLSDFEARLDQPLTERDTQTISDQLEAAASRIQERALDTMLAFGADLDHEQRVDFVAALQERQVELGEEWLERTDEAYYEAIIERFEDNFSDYIGRLTPEQKAVISDYSSEFIRIDTLWLEDRAQWIETLAAIIERDDPDWPAQVRAAVDQRADRRSLAYTTGYTHNTQQSWAIFRAVLNARTDVQDRRLRRSINDYIDDFISLAAEVDDGPREPAAAG